MKWYLILVLIYFTLKTNYVNIFLKLILEREEEEKERNINVVEIHQTVASHVCLHWGSNHNLGARDEAPTN